jgi:sortase A
MARKTISLILLLVSAVFIGGGGWIHAKAWLAQRLLEQAWQESRLYRQPVKPWPWADTWPVASLAVPDLSSEQIVLQGDGGNSLAFAPGMSIHNSNGLTLISAHRDTHFAFLAEVREGQHIQLQTMTDTRWFRVTARHVVDSRTTRITETGDARLVLVTCYPFDAWRAGGPLRYVVEAEPISM